MVEIYILSLLVFIVAVCALSVGVLVSGKQLKGHCGTPTFDEGCIKDSQGAKIISCGSCSCELERSSEFFK